MAFVVTAVATAVELGTFAAIATAVSEVGIAMSVVGAITGNKDLIKIGGILGIAGGVAGLAASFAGGAAGAAAEGAASTAVEGAVVNPAASAADYVSATDAMSDAASSGLNAGSTTATSTLAPELASSAAPQGIVQSAAAPAVAPEMTSAATPPPQAQLAPTQATTNGMPGPVDVTAPQGPAAPSSPADEFVQGNSSNALDAHTGAGYGGSTGMFDQFSGWVRANPKLAELGMQVVGGAMKGMSDYSLKNREMDLYQQRLDQTSYGNQVGSYLPVNPNPGIVAGAKQ